jgi:flagellar basal body-associated protein FliL
MTNQLSPSQQRIFLSLFILAVIALVSFAVLFFVLCSKENLSRRSKEVKERNIDTHPVLGQFGSTGAAIIIIGMPLLFILLTWLYLHAYRR